MILQTDVFCISILTMTIEAVIFSMSLPSALADGLIENDVKQPNDLSWDAVWEGVPRIDQEGWSVVMNFYIPSSGLTKETTKCGESMLNDLSAGDSKQIYFVIRQGTKADLHHGFLL